MISSFWKTYIPFAFLFIKIVRILYNLFVYCLNLLTLTLEVCVSTCCSHTARYNPCGSHRKCVHHHCCSSGEMCYGLRSFHKHQSKHQPNKISNGQFNLNIKSKFTFKPLAQYSGYHFTSSMVNTVSLPGQLLPFYFRYICYHFPSGTVVTIFLPVQWLTFSSWIFVTIFPLDQLLPFYFRQSCYHFPSGLVVTIFLPVEWLPFYSLISGYHFPSFIVVSILHPVQCLPFSFLYSCYHFPTCIVVPFSFQYCSYHFLLGMVATIFGGYHFASGIVVTIFLPVLWLQFSFWYGGYHFPSVQWLLFFVQYSGYQFPSGKVVTIFLPVQWLTFSVRYSC